ncbi:MAG: hypothetical protein JW723_15120 [Bacteroidales bacterium]|nr:hypothetical protein [Bacteroidales bacterium]
MSVRKTSIITLTAVLTIFVIMLGTQTGDTGEAASDSRTGLRIMFYNVENLFDCIDDPLTGDNEFTPEGQMHWTEKRFRAKLNNLYRVIVAAGGWKPPELIAFAEIENRFVLDQLVSETPLLKYSYEIIHKDSPDQRGIDVALIYRPGHLDKISEKFFCIDYADEAIPKTRDILYCAFRVNLKDTIHVFVNHWPSRSGGQLSSEKNRLYVASVLKSKTDSLFRVDERTKIIIVGDFNDQPDNKSLLKALQAKFIENHTEPGNLFNLSSCSTKKGGCGTHKYKGNWSILDQVIVSGGLLHKDGVFILPDAYKIFNPPFLLEPDDKYLGSKPYRTYSGFKYNGGYSDHLPVYADLKFSP